MSGDWNEQLERRADGLVPGYVGNNDQAAPSALLTGNLESIVSGLAAARPAANAYKGWYFSTDTQTLEHSDGATWTAAGGGGGGGDSLPVADTAGVAVDTTTYDNPVTGSGKITTLVFPTDADTAMLAVANDGDAFPRLLMTNDFSDGIYFGDGTIDPYNDAAGSSIFGDADRVGINVGSHGFRFMQQVANVLAGFSSQLPINVKGGVCIHAGSVDPNGAEAGNAGDLYIRESISGSTWLYQCTTSGDAAGAVWAAQSGTSVPLVLEGTDPATVPLTVVGAAAQTDLLLDVQDSANVSRVSVGPDGTFTMNHPGHGGLSNDPEFVLNTPELADDGVDVLQVFSVDENAPLFNVDSAGGVEVNLLSADAQVLIGRAIVSNATGFHIGAPSRFTNVGADVFIDNTGFQVRDTNGNSAFTALAGGTIGGKIGFFNKADTPIVQPTGVAVTAAGIHAALVALGLITA